MLKRIISFFLALVLFFNVTFETLEDSYNIPFEPVSVQADVVGGVVAGGAIGGPVGVLIAGVATIAVLGYGVLITTDVGQYVDVPGIPSDEVGIPGVSIPDGLTGDDFSDSYSVSEERLKWVVAGVYSEQFGGEKPDPNKDPRHTSTWLNLVASSMLSHDAYNFYMNQASQITDDVLNIIKNGVPEGWWGYGDCSTPAGFLTDWKFYNFDDSTGGLVQEGISGNWEDIYSGSFRKSFVDSWNMGYSSSSHFYPPASSYIKDGYLDKGMICSMGSNAFVKNYVSYVYLTKPGTSFTLVPYSNRYAFSCSSDGGGYVRFDHVNENYSGTPEGYLLNGNYYNSSTGAVFYNHNDFSIYDKNGRQGFWTNMAYDSVKNELYTPVNVNPYTNIQYIDPSILDMSIQNNYNPVSPAGTVYDPISGDVINDWSYLDLLTKDDLYEILKNPELYDQLANSLDFQDPNTGKIVENTNSVKEDTSDILTQIKKMPGNIWNKFSSVLSNLPSKIFNFFKSILDSIADFLKQILSILQNSPHLLREIFKSMFDSIVNGVNDVLTFLNKMPSAIYSFFEDVLDVIQSLLEALLEALSGFDITAIPSAIADGFKKILVPSESDLQTVKNSAGILFDKHFGMPKTVFTLLMIEGQDVPDIKCTLSGRTYTVVRFGWFNKFVEDFRPYIQLVFVLIWIFWLANQFLSLFDKSGIIAGKINDLKKGG